MALYAIGDTHLSLSGNKPMDVFGDNWNSYTKKLKEGFSKLNPEDICVICGDISWAMSLEEAESDLRFIDSMPGNKYILKGNHDYWWSTASKMTGFFDKCGIRSIKILHNNAYHYGDKAICGTKGWFFEEETGTAHDRKIMSRELIRLETSLKLGGDGEKLCFLHYPPLYNTYICHEIIELFDKYNVTTCCYGHIHSAGHRFAVTGKVGKTTYNMVSSDFIGFKPMKILP